MPPLTITVYNRSENTASYGVFAEPPSISPPTATTTRIITQVQGVASNQGQATFILSSQLIATCGIYDIDYDTSQSPDPKKKPVGTGTEVVDLRSVDLASKRLDGTPEPGSFLVIDCTSGTPSFSKEPATQTTTAVGSFSVRTRTDFTPQQAASNKFVVGYSCSVRQDIGPYATFVPNPGKTYQILPSNKFYVTIGSFNCRDLVRKPLTKDSDTVFVDFDQLQTDHVSIVHDEFGKLTVQMTPAVSATMNASNTAMNALAWGEPFGDPMKHEVAVLAHHNISVEHHDDAFDEASSTHASPTPQGSVA